MADLLELTPDLLAEIGGWPALKEARGLLERGKVRDVQREGALIQAKVHGTEKVYEARIILAERVAEVEVHCTCIEFKRSGRVCAHALAAGLAWLKPASSRRPAAIPVGSPRLPVSRISTLKRFPLDEAPVGIPSIEMTILLPLQLADSLARDPIRVILEAQGQPWDALVPKLSTGFAIGEADEQVLASLENLTGTITGINSIPRHRIGSFFKSLAGHPRVWLGKKQRIEILASDEIPKLLLSTSGDGTLVLKVEEPSSSDQIHSRPKALSLPIPNWTFDGISLTETPSLPPGFISSTRLIPKAQIPEFISRELPLLERSCDLVFAPGFEEFQLEIGEAEIEARLEGALSGLTLDLVARYGAEEYILADSSAPMAEIYLPDSGRINRFWRRNLVTERRALAQIEAAGFKRMRSGTSTFSLIQEKEVARFLANVLPRWRKEWTLRFGARLEAALGQIDIAQPEFSLRAGSGQGWLSLDLKLSVGGQPIALDPAEIQRWLQTGQTHARMANRRVLLIPTEAWGEMKEVLVDSAVSQESGRMQVPKTYAPFLSEALTAQGFLVGDNALAKIATPDVRSRLEGSLRAKMRPYQWEGVEWLARLARQNFSGLLADDMGLGKTLQALAFAAWLKDFRHPELVEGSVPPLGEEGTVARDSDGYPGDSLPRSQVALGNVSSPPLRCAPQNPPTLVVCPTSLVTNWLREAAKFTPHLRTLDLTGTDRAEKWARRNQHDLLVTSYAILRRDIELYRAQDFSLAILDEAQHIKNRGSQNAQSAKALRARHRLILTGTPLENSVLDLWSLYDFLLPGYLGTAAEFRERYETPLSRGPEPRVMRRLRQKVRPFFLRRTKEEVLKDLPPKLEHLALCELSDEQREVYRSILAQGRREVFQHAGKTGNGRDRLAVLTTLLRLRQVSCHLDLLPSGETRRVWKEPSAKMERTFELIDEAVDGGHRVLIFSQFVKALHLLRDEARRRDLRFCYLDGQTVERQAEVDRFQGDDAIPLFFISLKAGGTGLNLTGADTVIHFDPWWNPAVEEQATARAHRIGQSRKVQAYKLIAAGTVEEKIQALQARKRELFEASLGSDEAFVEKLTAADLEELLSD